MGYTVKRYQETGENKKIRLVDQKQQKKQESVSSEPSAGVTEGWLLLT